MRLGNACDTSPLLRMSSAILVCDYCDVTASRHGGVVGMRSCKRPEKGGFATLDTEREERRERRRAKKSARRLSVLINAGTAPVQGSF